MTRPTSPPDTMLQRLRALIPVGGTLPREDFEMRHRALCALMWGSLALLVLYSAGTGHYAIGHSAGHMAAVLPFALIAHRRSLAPRIRAIGCSLGLLTLAALAVHASGGTIEAHFTFFVFILALTVYEDWPPFLLSIGYVLLHHGVLGTIAPQEVYNRPEQYAAPWQWSAVHAFFVSCAGIAGVIAWGANERVRARMMATQRQLETAASTDALTGMGNRRRLLTDLDAAVARATPEAPISLTMFDLNGFKGYNDSFGHQAGDALLERLGRALSEAVEPWGTAYRLGGDEFCMLLSGGEATLAAALDAAESALTEYGDGFSVTTSHGSVLMPAQSSQADEAMRLADQRMYEQKTSGRRSAGAQSKDVLLRALAERHPDLGHRLDWVAELAEQAALQLGCPLDECEQIRHAAELHDIGKVAIPHDLLTKPGPLDADEQRYMRRHPTIGERIITAAPSLAFAARLVRASHERWDGRGYPDGIAGSMIPVGARVIAVCDALDAMLSDRPYQAAKTLPEALAELRRCSGTQFDPEVVQTVQDIVARRPATLAA